MERSGRQPERRPWGSPDPRRATIAAGFLALSIVAAGPNVSHAAGPDTLQLRVETGAGTDITNEQYYEDAFVDTTFLGRKLVSTPEARYAGVVFTSLQGTRGERATSYQLQNELSLGDRVQRNVLGLSWRQDFSPGWRLLLNPTGEWRHDQTFDRDQQEWRGSFRGRVRRTFADEATAAELGLVAEGVRTHGQGSQFLLDRNAGRAGVALDHLGLLGNEWRAGYSVTVRVFPDSSVRDHEEHGGEARWRQPFPGGHSLALEATGQRRRTQRIVTTSRDNFWQEQGSLEADWRADERWSIRLRVDGEAIQYDLEDSTTFFDYQVLRARLGPRFERDARWSIAAGPRAEILTARLDPAEGYREIGGFAELEILGRHAWWNVTPAAGWREYDAAEPAGLTVGLHSSFAFYELDAFVDQPLPERLRLRALTSLRYERHTDRAQDATSLYLSLQLRWTAY